MIGRYTLRTSEKIASQGVEGPISVYGSLFLFEKKNFTYLTVNHNKASLHYSSVVVDIMVLTNS